MTNHKWVRTSTRFFLVLIISILASFSAFGSQTRNPPLTAAQQEELEYIRKATTDFPAVEAVSTQITDHCRGHNPCVVIGVGQSPTPFLAYLLAKNNVQGSRYIVGDVPLTGLSYLSALETTWQAELVTHAKRYLDLLIGQLRIPFSEAAPQTIGVVIVDYVLSGMSLIHGSEIIEQAFADSHIRNVTFHHVGLCQCNAVGRPRGVDNIIDISAHKELADNLSDSAYKPFSMYGSFADARESTSVHPVERPHFKALVELYKGLLKAAPPHHPVAVAPLH